MQVIIPRTTKNHNIIQISFAIILKTFENFIYEPTERCWRVTETKSHVTPLPVSLRGHKPSQVNMFRGNRYLKIGLCHVQLRHNTAPPKRSNIESMRGIGNGSGTVTALSRRKSTHSRPVPSGFGTTRMGAAQALVLSSIIPSANKDSICKLTDRNLSG